MVRKIFQHIHFGINKLSINQPSSDHSIQTIRNLTLKFPVKWLYKLHSLVHVNNPSSHSHDDLLAMVAELHLRLLILLN
jgi:hypothetical protein